MASVDYNIYPLGEGALTICFGNEISSTQNDLVTGLAEALDKHKFHGFRECIPAYSSLTLIYDLFDVKRNFRTALSGFEIVRSLVEIEIHKLDPIPKTPKTPIEIPVSFRKTHALDLEFAADAARISTSQLIELFLAKTYRVFMLGFIPGFPYMGKIDKRISTPRKESPRVGVPKGSVGIAGVQTGIYPLESPGGWQIIGRTEMELFTPHADRPTFLSAGDLVRFVKD